MTDNTSTMTDKNNNNNNCKKKKGISSFDGTRSSTQHSSLSRKNPKRRNNKKSDNDSDVDNDKDMQDNEDRISGESVLLPAQGGGNNGDGVVVGGADVDVDVDVDDGDTRYGEIFETDQQQQKQFQYQEGEIQKNSNSEQEQQHHAKYRRYINENGNESDNRNRNRNRNSNSYSTNNKNKNAPNFLLSSLTQRLNKMSVRDRENATFDIHGIPLDDDDYNYNHLDDSHHLESSNDTESDIEEGKEDTTQTAPCIQNKIERNPQRIQELLLELDHLVEQKLMNNTSPEDRRGSDSDSGSQALAQAPFFGSGLRLARQQNPQYVQEQRMKFLRADRYDVDLAATRMIRCFDFKQELFGGSGAGRPDDEDGEIPNTTEYDNIECLGRDIRLSDFSQSDIALWKRSGFLQFCGLRDRAHRAIIMVFGKAILDFQIPALLVVRAYYYCVQLWSRDVSIQQSGFVFIGYSVLLPTTDVPSNSNSISTSTSIQPQSDVGVDVTVVNEYLQICRPLLEHVVKVSAFGKLRCVARHFCYDHPKMHLQYSLLAKHMSSINAARFRSHYAAPASDTKKDTSLNPHQELLYTLMTFGIPARDTIPINEETGEIDLEYNIALLEAIDERETQDVALLLLLEKETQQEAAAASEEEQDQQREQQREMKYQSPQEVEGEGEAAVTSMSTPLSMVASQAQTQTYDDRIKNNTSTSESSNYDDDGKQQRQRQRQNRRDSLDLWMSLTISTTSSVNTNMSSSFSLFPNLLQDSGNTLLDDTADDNNVELDVLDVFDFNSSTIHNNTDNNVNDTSSIHNMHNTHDMNTDTAATVTATATTASIVNNNNVGLAEGNGEDEEIIWVVEPKPYDIIMGRGPWNKSHPGNLRFKNLLTQQQNNYEAANRFEKMRIVDTMVKELLSSTTPNTDCFYLPRFLYKDKNTTPPTITAATTVTTTTTPTSWLRVHGPWLIATRDKAHDKITHDFRNRRRQKQQQQEKAKNQQQQQQYEQN